MVLTIVIIASILSLLSDIYLWQSVARHRARPWRYAHWIAPTALLAVVIFMLLGGRVSWMFMFVILYILLVCIPRSIHALLVLLRLPRIGYIARIALILIFLGGVLFGWKHLVVRQVPIVFSNLPTSFQGYRIVHISDLHLGTYDNEPQMVDKIVKEVNAQRPDLIVFTGDIVNLSTDELRPFIPTLSRLQALDGIVSILGNHDYCTYGAHDATRPADVQTRELMEMQRQMGWHLLLNEHIMLHRRGDSIAIAGIENGGRPPFPQRANLVGAMEGLHPETFTILLSHDPSFWRQSVTGQTNIPLTLSGHTHAMQMRIGNFSPSYLIYPEWGGLYTHNDQHLYVSTGTGSNIPFRLGAWPEIDVITLLVP